MEENEQFNEQNQNFFFVIFFSGNFIPCLNQFSEVMKMTSLVGLMKVAFILVVVFSVVKCEIVNDSELKENDLQQRKLKYKIKIGMLFARPWMMTLYNQI